MKVSENGRYLIGDDGVPFFYLADTAWKLCYMPDKKEVVEYLENRKQKGFTIIMPCLVFEGKIDGLDDIQNRDGQKPFLDNDPCKPNEDYFKHVDFIIEKGSEIGLKFAILPTWGEYVGPVAWGKGPTIFNKENARVYGEFLGKRYGNKEVIWVLGGDRIPETPEIIEVWKALVAGLKAGDGGKNLVTYHPRGYFSSSEFFHDEPWLDFNMMQTSTKLDQYHYTMILNDYNKTPVKPVVDGETRYENSHEYFYLPPPNSGRRINAMDVRRAAYECILSGAMGHTYGCRDLWSFNEPSDIPPVIDVNMHWKKAMDLPGAFNMGFVKKLFEKYPWYKLIPDQENKLLVHGSLENYNHISAGISEDSDFAVIYFPDVQPASLDLGQLRGESVTSLWFDPSNGNCIHEETQAASGVKRFMPPEDIEHKDYVLVLKSSI